jgi:cytidylate kinase
MIGHDQDGFIPGMQGCQHMQINKCNTAHKQNKIYKSHDHVNRCRKSLHQNSAPLLDKKAIYDNIIKAIHDKPIANIILNVGKTESISSKVRNKTREVLDRVLVAESRDQGTVVQSQPRQIVHETLS